MKLRLRGRTCRGRALDLRQRQVDPAAIASAIEDRDASRVVAPPPGPAHPFVGLLEPGMSLSLTSALAAAARSRGWRSPFDDAIERAERAIEATAVEPVDLVPARRRAARAGADVDGRREEVARLRGRLEADREAGRSTGAAERALREAIASLSEAETEALAAEQALATAERSARAARDERERRLALVDERDNLVRRARQALATRTYPRFRAALSALPVDPGVGDGGEAVAGEGRDTVGRESGADGGEGAADGLGRGPSDYAGDPFAAGLAVARVARLSAPVVLVDGPFSAPVAARAALDAQVVLM